MRRAVHNFIEHAKEEEDDQLPVIKQKLDAKENDVRNHNPTPKH